jgi:hypothetical protein
VIDIENIVFDTVAKALRTAFPATSTSKEIFVSGDTTAAPSSFPAATLVEMDNATHAATLDSSMTENHADLMYQAEAYSNLSSGKKSQCKAIMAVIDTQMTALGFVRVGSGPQGLPNADATKYRMVARYKALAGKSIDNTKIQIYRR